MGKILIIANIFQLINLRSIVVVVHCSQIILYFCLFYVEILHRLLNLDQLQDTVLHFFDCLKFGESQTSLV